QQQANLPGFVDGYYQDQGICVRGRWSPILKMRWVEGVTLAQFVRDFLDQPHMMGMAADRLQRLAQKLRPTGVAHCNLDPNHILVGGGRGRPIELRLVDYDTLFLSGLSECRLEEPGHRNFQHPQRLWQNTYDADADRFPLLVLYTVLRALAAEGRGLWERFGDDDNLLFRELDFEEPAGSALFRELWRSTDPTVRALAGQLLLAAQGKLEEVPHLDDVTSSLSAAQEIRVEAGLSTQGAGAAPLRGTTRTGGPDETGH